MPAVSLCAHVRAVDVDEDLVLLDIARDAYLCLPGAGAVWRPWHGRGARVDAAEPLARALLEAGLAETAGTDPPPPPDPTLPARRIAPAAGVRLRWRDGLVLLLAWLDLQRGYRGRSFAEILAYARARPRAATNSDPGELARLCEAFHRLAVWLPLSDKCLERSFVLLRFLQRSGADARWRFGVRLWPFGAHCWLQAGDTALDDWPERLAAYTPIHDA